MLVLLRKQWKLYPATSLLVGIALVLFIVTRLYWGWTWLPWAVSEAITWIVDITGFFADLRPVAGILGSVEGADINDVLETFGALGIGQLWEGQIWRLLVSAFHHGFQLHIAGNLVVLVLLGQIIEERYDSWWFAAFCIGSAIFSVAAEALIAQPSVGLSGTGYAMFGFLVIVRRREPYIAMQIPTIVVNAGIISMFVCLPITWLGILPVANIAHFSGFAYGLAGGFAMIARRENLGHSTFAFAHLLLVPLCYLATAPTWTNFYHDLRAEQRIQSTADPKVRVDTLQGLLDKYPDRTNIRVRLVSALSMDDRNDAAFSCALAGWDGTNSDAQQLLARQIDQLSRLADADHQVQGFGSMLKDFPRRTDVRIRAVAALVLADQRDDAWKVALEGWDGTYTLPQQALRQQIQGVWKLMPNPDARAAADDVMDKVMGERSEKLKEEFDLGWLSVQSRDMWIREKQRAAAAQASTPKLRLKFDPDSPDSAGRGRQL